MKDFSWKFSIFSSERQVVLVIFITNGGSSNKAINKLRNFNDKDVLNFGRSKIYHYTPNLLL